MRVLHVMASVAARHGGPTEAAFGMARGLRESGVDARIVSSDDDLGGHLPVPLNRWTEHAGVPTYFIRRVGSNQHTLAGFTFAPGFIGWLRREIPRQDFIHVHTVFSFPATVAMTIARQRRKPYAARPLGQLCGWSLGVRSPLKKLQLAVIGRRNLDAAAFLHVTSDMEANETAKLRLRCPIKVLPLGISMAENSRNGEYLLRTELGIPNENRIALFLSRIHEKKGLDVLLRAVARAPIQELNLVICGDGDERYVDELQELAAELGIGSRVHWVGFVTGERKWKIARSCDFFVLPSHSENFGIAVLEALACGLFVIVSPNVGLASQIGRAPLGRVVPIEDAALADALVSVARSEDFTPASREARRTFVAQNFSWKAATDRLVVAYEEAISRCH